MSTLEYDLIVSKLSPGCKFDNCNKYATYLVVTVHMIQSTTLLILAHVL